MHDKTENIPMEKQEKETLLRKPEWLRLKPCNAPHYANVSHIVKDHALHTICASGRCPNQNECWSRGTATFMVMGDICTRGCKFCATTTGKPLPLNPKEPENVAESIHLMGLKHCVITSVDRDDLPDAGAEHWAKIVTAIREKNPDTTIELLIPDFDGREELIDRVINAKPDIIGHNIETCRSMTPKVRSKATYDTSLKVLKHIADKGMICKSGMMVGIGETDEEVIETMKDLRAAGCNIFTIGQYLRPTRAHYPVDRYVHPDTFEMYKQKGLEMGFDYIASAPMVRSSYLADKAISAVRARINNEK